MPLCDASHRAPAKYNKKDSSYPHTIASVDFSCQWTFFLPGADELEIALVVATVLYLGLLIALASYAKNKVHDEADFMAAGRRLPTVFASATLFATWFGAGTLLTATDAIYEQGLAITALEPFGAGACLLLAGMFFARRLWNLQILTVPELFGKKFGPRAEFVSAVLMVPGYFGWIAVQITALSGIIHLFFGLDLAIAMIAVTAFATLLACLGGMWSITLTDLVQMIFVLAVIVVLAGTVVTMLGDGEMIAGIHELVKRAQSDQHTRAVPPLFSLNLFIIAALGNLPGQDLAQRIFSAKSASIAKRSCLIAGIFYVIFGSISILLGLAARSLLPPDVTSSVIPHLAKHVLSPVLAIPLLLAIISIIISTMDSAMLATSSIIAHNLIRPYVKNNRISVVTWCRISVVGVALFSLLLAFVGKNAYVLLENSYAISLTGLFAPFAIGLYIKTGNERAAITSMAVGLLWWALGFIFDEWWFSEIAATSMSFISYVAIYGFYRVARTKLVNA